MLMSISELTPVKGTGMYSYYKAAAVFAALSLLLGVVGRRIYLLDLLLFSIAFKGAFDSARAVSMMGLFLSPGISLHLTGFFGKLKESFAPERTAKRHDPVRGREKKRKKKGKKETVGTKRPAVPSRKSLSWGNVAALAVILVAVVSFGIVTLSFSFSQLEYGVGMTEHKFSFEAVDFLKKNPIPGKMFNFFDVGGFLDWQLYPDALTFIDGRAVNSEVFQDHQAVTGALPGWEEILRRYGVTYIVSKTMDSSGMILPLIPSLAEDPAWSLVFADGLFVVFVRNQPEFQEYIRKFGIPKQVLPQKIIREAYHYMYLGVSPVVAYTTISNMHMVMGNRAAAVDALRQGLAEENNPVLRIRLEQLERGGVFPNR